MRIDNFNGSGYNYTENGVVYTQGDALQATKHQSRNVSVYDCDVNNTVNQTTTVRYANLVYGSNGVSTDALGGNNTGPYAPDRRRIKVCSNTNNEDITITTTHLFYYAPTSKDPFTYTYMFNQEHPCLPGGFMTYNNNKSITWTLRYVQGHHNLCGNQGEDVIFEMKRIDSRADTRCQCFYVYGFHDRQIVRTTITRNTQLQYPDTQVPTTVDVHPHCRKKSIFINKEGECKDVYSAYLYTGYALSVFGSASTPVWDTPTPLYNNPLCVNCEDGTQPVAPEPEPEEYTGCYACTELTVSMTAIVPDIYRDENDNILNGGSAGARPIYIQYYACGDCSTNNWLGNVEDFDGSVFKLDPAGLPAREGTDTKTVCICCPEDNNIWFRFVDTDPNSGSSSFGVTGVLKTKNGEPNLSGTITSGTDRITIKVLFNGVLEIILHHVLHVIVKIHVKNLD